jgi:peptide/nickel transport system permease protein
VSLAPPIPEALGAGALDEERPRGRFRVVRRLGRTGALGAILILGLAVCAIFAPWLAPYDPNYQHPNGLTALAEPQGIGAEGFALGTDELGRDELSRLIYGTRVALFIAIVPNVLCLLVATMVGSTAGYFGGRVDTILMRFTEMVMTLPALLIALALIAVSGSGLGIIVLALVLVTWTYPARVVYGEVVRVREYTHVEAARALGARAGRIHVRHVAPPQKGLLGG